MIMEFVLLVYVVNVILDFPSSKMRLQESEIDLANAQSKLAIRMKELGFEWASQRWTSYKGKVAHVILYVQ